MGLWNIAEGRVIKKKNKAIRQTGLFQNNYDKLSAAGGISHWRYWVLLSLKCSIMEPERSIIH